MEVWRSHPVFLSASLLQWGCAPRGNCSTEGYGAALRRHDVFVGRAGALSGGRMLSQLIGQFVHAADVESGSYAIACRCCASERGAAYGPAEPVTALILVRHSVVECGLVNGGGVGRRDHRVGRWQRSGVTDKYGGSRPHGRWRRLWGAASATPAMEA